MNSCLFCHLLLLGIFWVRLSRKLSEIIHLVVSLGFFCFLENTLSTKGFFTPMVLMLNCQPVLSYLPLRQKTADYIPSRTEPITLYHSYQIEI